MEVEKASSVLPEFQPRKHLTRQMQPIPKARVELTAYFMLRYKRAFGSPDLRRYARKGHSTRATKEVFQQSRPCLLLIIEI